MELVSSVLIPAFAFHEVQAEEVKLFMLSSRTSLETVLKAMSDIWEPGQSFEER